MDPSSGQQISELLARAAYALDNKDVPMLMACFDTKACFTLTIGGGEASVFDGAQSIRELMENTLEAQTDIRRHIISNVFCEYSSSDEASVKSYLSLLSTENGESRLLTPGVYSDTVARTGADGGWVITDRQLHLDRAF